MSLSLSEIHTPLRRYPSTTNQESELLFPVALMPASQLKTSYQNLSFLK